jgi:hypothetical protein
MSFMLISRKTDICLGISSSAGSGMCRRACAAALACPNRKGRRGSSLRRCLASWQTPQQRQMLSLIDLCLMHKVCVVTACLCTLSIHHSTSCFDTFGPGRRRTLGSFDYIRRGRYPLLESLESRNDSKKKFLHLLLRV